MRLDRLLWRFGHGVVGSAEIEKQLEEASRLLIEQRYALDSQRSDLLRLAGDALRSFDQHSNAAVQQIAACEFPEAVASMLLAQEALSKLQRTALGWERLEGIRERHEAFCDQLHLKSVRELPTLRVVDRLRDCAETLLATGEDRKARFVAEVARRESERLRSPGRKDLERARNALKTLQFLATGANGTPAQQVEAVHRLLADCHWTLAEGLIDDLTSEAAARNGHSSREALSTLLLQVTRQAEVVLGRMGAISFIGQD